MKKLLFLLLFLPLFTCGQNARFLWIDDYDISTTGDTSFNISVTDEVVWNITAIWSTFADSAAPLTDTLDGVFKMQMSASEGNSFQDYFDMDTTITNTQNGSTAFEDWMFSGDKLRLQFVKNNLATGTFDVWITYKIKQ